VCDCEGPGRFSCVVCMLRDVVCFVVIVCDLWCAGFGCLAIAPLFLPPFCVWPRWCPLRVCHIVPCGMSVPFSWVGEFFNRTLSGSAWTQFFCVWFFSPVMIFFPRFFWDCFSCLFSAHCLSALLPLLCRAVISRPPCVSCVQSKPFYLPRAGGSLVRTASRGVCVCVWRGYPPSPPP
jgi:hypothetical protein